MSAGPHGLQRAVSGDFRRKILAPADLARELSRRRASWPRPKVVQCHGCFDIVHPGHIRYLQFARSCGDILLVSITGDASIDKGPARPAIPQELRAENLAALEFVDFVTIDPNPTAAELLSALRPDVYVKGREYATSADPRFLEERRVVEAAGGSIVFSSGDVVFSSTRLVEESPGAGELEAQRLFHVCRRHDILRASLDGILGRMRGARLLVVGDLIVERYVACDAVGSAAEAPMMNLRELERRDHLGGAAFVAALAAALGAKPTLAVSLGNDDVSRRAAGELRRAGVCVLAAPRREEAPVRTRYLVDEQKVLLVERGSGCPLDSRAERDLANEILAACEAVNAAILLDGGLGTLSPGLLELVGPRLRERVGTLAAGAADAPLNRRTWRDADLVCVSERRLRTALNDRASGLSVLAHRMLDATRAGRMIATLGKRGLVTFRRPDESPATRARHDRLLSEHLPALAGRTIDRLGAAETVLAVAALATQAGANLMQTAYLAGLAAGLQLGRVGPATLTLDELRGAMDSRPELIAEPAVSDGAAGRSAAPRPMRPVVQHA